MSDEERVSPVEVVAGFIASEVGHWSPGMAEQARELIDALEAAGWQIVAGDAVAEEVVTAARASLWEQLESEAVERLTAEVERLRAMIDMLRITLPRPDRLQAVRSVCRDDHPISLVLARVEAARALLDTEGGKT